MTCPGFELFKDSQPQLGRVLKFLQNEALPRLGGGPMRVNVPNKRPGQAQHLLHIARTVSKDIPGAEVCLHYSLKYQSGGVPAFQEFCKEANSIDGCSVLLVSGTGRKLKLDSCKCLEDLAREGPTGRGPRVGVAFSPYEDPRSEQARLLRKLGTGNVSEVWLQLGSDLEKLRNGLNFLRANGATGLHGSVFLPTEAVLAKQRARPWAGVYLSDQYLSSVASAEAITVKVLQLYAEFGVTSLVETPVEDAASVNALAQILERVHDMPAIQRVHEVPAASASVPDVAPRQDMSSRRWGRNNEPKAAAPIPTISQTQSHTKSDVVVIEQQTSVPEVASSSARIANYPQDIGIVWLRQDLRTHDNPALFEAAKKHHAVLPVFLWSPEEEGDAKPGGAAQIWLTESLRSLAADLDRMGSKLILRHTTCYEEALLDIAKEVGSSHVYACRRYEPWNERLDRRVSAGLKTHGIRYEDFPSYLLFEPRSVDLGRGYSSGHWGTLMPFYKACLSTGKPRRPIPVPPSLGRRVEISSTPIASLGLDSGISKGGEDWGSIIKKAWPDISESKALKVLREFIESEGGLQNYERNRSRADLPKNPNSKLSAYLRWGQLSPHDLYWGVQDAKLPYEATKTFGRRLIWRDLAYFQLYNFPGMRTKSIRAHYDAAEWSTNRHHLRCWKKGLTGYPLVDASMRELRATGWVQQNVRMVAASFLTEFLNISWVEGAKWYEDELVDADLAINSMMWQNAGRSGIDQWNFLISPVEAKAQDPTGSYVRKWVPELAKLPNKFLHKPWEASTQDLRNADVVLGDNYPQRCIQDLYGARDVAKQATLRMRRQIADTWMNDNQGYDVISLPGGVTTKVFTKQEYRIAKDGHQLRPSAGASKPPKGGGKGKASGKRNSEQTSVPAAKSPRVEGRQLSIEEFKSGQPKTSRWTRLMKSVDIVMPCIEID